MGAEFLRVRARESGQTRCRLTQKPLKQRGTQLASPTRSKCSTSEPQQPKKRNEVRAMYIKVYLGRLIPIIVFVVAAASASLAQDGRIAGGEGRILELIDELKDLIQSAETARSTDRHLVQELGEIVRRYDWPWRVSLLHDDFRDGDYTSDPSWIAKRGDFSVTLAGLRTRFEPINPSRKTSENTALDLLEGIFRGVAERTVESQPEGPLAADIYTDLRITNAFAVKLDIASREYFEGGSRLEFGPYRGSQQDWGYRLVYEPGKTPSFTLLRVAPGRSSIIEIADALDDLDDGRTHQIEWRRAPDGEMLVRLDGKDIIRTVDRANTDSFEGFMISNKGGDYTIRRIAIFGAHK
jgi:hypothetical protein